MNIKDTSQYNIIVRANHQDIIDRFFETYLPTIKGFDVKTWVIHPEGIEIPEGVISITTDNLNDKTIIPILREIIHPIGRLIWHNPDVYFGIFNDDLIFTDGWLRDVGEALKVYDSVSPGYINTSSVNELNKAVEETKNDTGIVEFFMGSCQIHRMGILVQIGMLDPQFGWSCGDFDLVWRIKLNGLKSVTLRKITIAHVGGESRNRERSRWFTAAKEGKIIFCDKHGAQAFKNVRKIYEGHDYFINKRYERK
jgi:hypothetical protein